jgi:hypothetical protein
VLNECLSHEQDGPHVDTHEQLVLLHGHGLEGGIAAQASVVDQDVEASGLEGFQGGSDNSQWRF